MSKVSFRARALDANRPLHIHYDHEILDLSDYASISRQVPLLPTGMEKDEETEQHLQEALFAQQQFKSTDLHSIPIPEIDENANRFKSLYQSLPSLKLPRQYIRVQSFFCDTLESDVSEYDMDSEDEEWLAQSRLDITEIVFEQMLARLERSSDHTVISLKEAKALLKKDDGLTTAVYDYWLTKRLKNKASLIPTLKADRRDVVSNTDPYVAFRRRTEKMQTRKHRKNDEACYEKMLKLKKDMERATVLFELLMRREEVKKELIKADCNVFCQRYEEKDFDGSKMKAALSARQSQLSAKEIHRKRALDVRWSSPKKSGKFGGRVPDYPTEKVAKPEQSDSLSFNQRRLGAVYLPAKQVPTSAECQQSFQLTCLPHISHSRRKQFTGYVRLRRGRGGRVWVDRLPYPTPSDSYMAARDLHFSSAPSPPPVQDAGSGEIIEEDPLWSLKVDPFELATVTSSYDDFSSSPHYESSTCYHQPSGSNGLRYYRHVPEDLT